MQSSGQPPGYQPCGLEKHGYGSDRPHNHKSAISSVQVFLCSFSLTIREIDTALLASLAVKSTGIDSIVSWCPP